MIKKITKCLLALSLLLTGVVLNPTRINAEESSLYAGAAQIWEETDVIYADLGSAGIVYLEPTFRFTKYQGNTEMTFLRVTGRNTTGTTIVDNITATYSGTSDLNSNSYLTVLFTIKTVNNNKTYVTVYKIMYLHNQIHKRLVFSQERIA